MRTPLLALLCLLISTAAHADDHSRFQKFFDTYQALSAEFDPAIIKLYADDAKITGVRTKTDGTEETMTINGTRWRTIIASSLERAKQVGDLSKFSNVKIDVDGNKAKISASRYTSIDCFTDDRFYMVVEPAADDQLQITEQAMHSSMTASCGDDEKELADFLARTVNMINDQLPAAVDAETQLINTSSEGTRLIYQYVLNNQTTATLSAEDATAKLMPLVIQQSCTSQNLSPILNQGGSLSFIYIGSDAAKIVQLDIDKSNCPK